MIYDKGELIRKGGLRRNNLNNKHQSRGHRLAVADDATDRLFSTYLCVYFHLTSTMFSITLEYMVLTHSLSYEI